MNENLIEVDRKFYMKSKVIMLATKKAPNGLDRIWYNEFQKDNKVIYGVVKPTGNYNPQHLYLLFHKPISNLNEINSNIPLMFISNNGLIKNITYSNRRIKTLGEYYEIIATTDKFFTTEWLYTCFSGEEIYKFFPRPSNDFLRKFCELDGIDEVLIQYEGVNYDLFMGQKYIHEYYKPKLSPDNTITIKPINLIKK